MPSGLTNKKADDVGRELGTRWRLSGRECTVRTRLPLANTPRCGSDVPSVTCVCASAITDPLRVDKIIKNVGNTDLNITTVCPLEL